jgi:hypothetical protein
VRTYSQLCTLHADAVEVWVLLEADAGSSCIHTPLHPAGHNSSSTTAVTSTPGVCALRFPSSFTTAAAQQGAAQQQHNSTAWCYEGRARAQRQAQSSKCRVKGTAGSCYYRHCVQELVVCLQLGMDMLMMCVMCQMCGHFRLSVRMLPMLMLLLSGLHLPLAIHWWCLHACEASLSEGLG